MYEYLGRGYPCRNHGRCCCGGRQKEEQLEFFVLV